MKLYQEGDQSKAICEYCQRVVATTMRYRDVPFSDGSGTVKDVLAGVCDECQSVISIPAQSTPAIAKTKKHADQPVEAQLPALYLDALDLACYRLDPEASTEFRKRLLMYYIHKYATKQLNSKELLKIASLPNNVFSPSALKRRKRVSFKITHAMHLEMDQVIETTSLSKTELIGSVVLKIKTDVVDSKPSSKTFVDLKTFAAAASC